MSPSERTGAIVSRLAHELKTPLAVIAGFAELLAARDDERTRKEAATRIMEGSRQLSSVIDDLVAGIAADKGDLALRLQGAVDAQRRQRDDSASK